MYLRLFPHFNLYMQWTISILLSILCGGLIGYERQNKLKSAGLKTHMLVSLGSTLIMIISKYACTNMLGLNNISYDPSRIAAQVVSGIGFIGAGTIILTKHNFVDGLTTATGLWASAAVGLAIGGDLYFLGIIGTIGILLIYTVVSHLDNHKITNQTGMNLFLDFSGNVQDVQELEENLKSYNYPDADISIISCHEKIFYLRLYVSINSDHDFLHLITYLTNNSKIHSIDLE